MTFFTYILLRCLSSTFIIFETFMKKKILRQNLSSIIQPYKCFLFVYLFAFMADPAASGASWARCLFGAAAAGLHHSHSNAGSLIH